MRGNKYSVYFPDRRKLSIVLFNIYSVKEGPRTPSISATMRLPGQSVAHPNGHKGPSGRRGRLEGRSWPRHAATNARWAFVALPNGHDGPAGVHGLF